MPTIAVQDLPGLNCGLCGYRTCGEMAEELPKNPQLLKRCIYLSDQRVKPAACNAAKGSVSVKQEAAALAICGGCATASTPARSSEFSGVPQWRDSLGRDFDFYLEHFPEDPGPREIILPHNPLITREMDIQKKDVLIGRPLGMSCGCPITHCGIVMEVDKKTGVIVWCVTGPLQPRQQGFKDIGYYIAEGYEGLIKLTRTEIKIGMRYYFQPRLCMLQWRHSGLVNYMNRLSDGLQVRVEGLWIG
jgi:uncharacterized Fe-S cluster-containing protein